MGKRTEKLKYADLRQAVKREREWNNEAGECRAKGRLGAVSVRALLFLTYIAFRIF